MEPVCQADEEEDENGRDFMKDIFVKIHETKKMDLKDAIVIDGFPSVGLVSTICAYYLIDALGLKQIGTIESPYFPTISIINAGVPMSPARIYAGKVDKDNVVVFVSEFQPAPMLLWPIAETIMEWAKKKGCRTIISPEGMVVEKPKDVAVEDVYGISSSPVLSAELVRNGVKIMGSGLITGISSAMLNSSKRVGMDVVTLLAEVHPEYPNARAAAKIIEVIDRMLLKHTEIDVAPLYREAERIEEMIKMLHKQAEIIKKGTPPPPIYA